MSGAEVLSAVGMALDTIRQHKMRSLLTVLGGEGAVGAGRAPDQVGGRLVQAAGPAAELRSMVNSP